MSLALYLLAFPEFFHVFLTLSVFFPVVFVFLVTHMLSPCFLLTYFFDMLMSIIEMDSPHKKPPEKAFTLLPVALIYNLMILFS